MEGEECPGFVWKVVHEGIQEGGGVPPGAGGFRGRSGPSLGSQPPPAAPLEVRAAGER